MVSDTICLPAGRGSRGRQAPGPAAVAFENAGIETSDWKGHFWIHGNSAMNQHVDREFDSELFRGSLVCFNFLFDGMYLILG